MGLAREGTLSYFSSDVLCEISIRDLCDLYGFNKDREIKSRITMWKNANQPPANAMLISGDEDYLGELLGFKTMGFNNLQAYRPEATT